jgi:phospholipid/cholesterol/gamma-HCH transport system permease protein
VAFCGCYQGIRCGRNAQAVGIATTRAVVSGITALIVADALFAVLANKLHL